MSRRGSDRESCDFAVGFFAKNWISMGFIRWVILESRGGLSGLSHAYITQVEVARVSRGQE